MKCPFLQCLWYHFTWHTLSASQDLRNANLHSSKQHGACSTTKVIIINKSVTSHAWKYFAFEADERGNIMDPHKPVWKSCCPTCQTKGGNTRSLLIFSRSLNWWVSLQNILTTLWPSCFPLSCCWKFLSRNKSYAMPLATYVRAVDFYTNTFWSCACSLSGSSLEAYVTPLVSIRLIHA